MLVLIALLALWYHFRERHVFTGPSWIGKGMAAPAESDAAIE